MPQVFFIDFEYIITKFRDISSLVVIMSLSIYFGDCTGNVTFKELGTFAIGYIYRTTTKEVDLYNPAGPPFNIGDVLMGHNFIIFIVCKNLHMFNVYSISLWDYYIIASIDLSRAKGLTKITMYLNNNNNLSPYTSLVFEQSGLNQLLKTLRFRADAVEVI